MAKGRTATIGCAEQSAYATWTSATNYRPAKNIGDGERRPVEVVDDMYAPGVGGHARHNQGQAVVNTPLSFFATYTNIGIWLKHAMGAVATAGAGPYVHTFTLAELPAFGLSLELIRGAGWSNAERIAGAKINDWTLSGAAGATPLLFECTILGRSSAWASASTPTYGTEALIKPQHVGVLGFNSNTYKLRDFRLSSSNSLERRDHMGSAYTDEPEGGGFRDVTLQATIEVTDETLITEHGADTTGNVTLTATGTGNNALAITGYNGFITEVSAPTNQAGRLLQTVTWKMAPDASNSALKLALTNDNATATAN